MIALALRRSKRSLSGFTLVELLVVIGIISILIAMLLPALNKVRQQARVVACGSQERQIALSLLMYAQDNKGWFPKVYWGTAYALRDETSGDTKNPADIKPYMPTASVLRCPAQWDGMRTAYFGYYNDPEVYIGSYYILAAHGDHPSGPSSYWFGWIMYNTSSPSATYRAPIPRAVWAGRTITDPVSRVREYIDTSDKQPMVVDCFDPVDGTWGGAYGLSTHTPGNHSGMKGENIAFVDGHVEWRQSKLASDGTIAPTSQVQQRFWTNGGWVFW